MYMFIYNVNVSAYMFPIHTFKVSIYPLQILVRRDAIGVKILLAYIRRTGVETSTSPYFR